MHCGSVMRRQSSFRTPPRLLKKNPINDGVSSSKGKSVIKCLSDNNRKVFGIFVWIGQEEPMSIREGRETGMRSVLPK